MFLFLALFFVLSCKQAETPALEGIDFLFKETQPVNDSEILHFPNRFLGSYMDKDSIFLIISKKDIYYKRVNKNKISFNLFDSIKDSLKIVSNRIYLKADQFIEYRKLKDSIEITDNSYDTIFSISSQQRAKKINKTIILNTLDSIYWNTEYFKFEKNILIIKKLYSYDDLKRIDSLSKIKSIKIDSTKNRIQLSRKEFRKMLSLKNLGYDRVFKKTKE